VVKLCICGDFNAIRSTEERKSRRVGLQQANFDHFNNFIDNNFLADLPLCGRKFTWYKGDGYSMIRIDRFMLLEDWCLSWLNSNQVAQPRGLTGNCLVCFLLMRKIGALCLYRC